MGRQGRSPGFRIFLLPGLPTGATAMSGDRDPPVQWLVPVSYPVTVAGAAPDSHRLPFQDEPPRGGGVTAPSVLSKTVPPRRGDLRCVAYPGFYCGGGVEAYGVIRPMGMPWVWFGCTNCCTV